MPRLLGLSAAVESADVVFEGGGFFAGVRSDADELLDDLLGLPALREQVLDGGIEVGVAGAGAAAWAFPGAGSVEEFFGGHKRDSETLRRGAWETVLPAEGVAVAGGEAGAAGFALVFAGGLAEGIGESADDAEGPMQAPEDRWAQFHGARGGTLGGTHAEGGSGESKEGVREAGFHGGGEV